MTGIAKLQTVQMLSFLTYNKIRVQVFIVTYAAQNGAQNAGMYSLKESHANIIHKRMKVLQLNKC